MRLADPENETKLDVKRGRSKVLVALCFGLYLDRRNCAPSSVFPKCYWALRACKFEKLPTKNLIRASFRLLHCAPNRNFKNEDYSSCIPLFPKCSHCRFAVYTPIAEHFFNAYEQDSQTPKRFFLHRYQKITRWTDVSLSFCRHARTLPFSLFLTRILKKTDNFVFILKDHPPSYTSPALPDNSSFSLSEQTPLQFLRSQHNWTPPATFHPAISQISPSHHLSFFVALPFTLHIAFLIALLFLLLPEPVLVL